jgi:hypothetical protein
MMNTESGWLSMKGWRPKHEGAYLRGSERALRGYRAAAVPPAATDLRKSLRLVIRIKGFAPSLSYGQSL